MKTATIKDVRREDKDSTVKIKRLRLYGVGALFICVLLSFIKITSDTVSTSFYSLAEALKNADQKQIEQQCPSDGLKALHVVTARYGEYRLGNYLEGEKYKTSKPSPNVVDITTYLEEIDGKMREEPTSKPTIFTMKRIWLDWKIINVRKAP